MRILTRSELTRRQALQLLGAGLALTQARCLATPGGEVLPYVRQPEDAPGGVITYATSMMLDGFATGLIVERHEARPTKIEGNPDHPASLGGTTAIQQASIYDLYDPHRLRAPLRHGAPVDWDRALALLAAPMPGPLWIVMPPESGPTAAALIARIRERHPETRVVHHAAIARDTITEGARLAFGAALEPQHAFDRADVVLALDADPAGRGPMSPAWARQLASRRRALTSDAQPSRIWVAEPMITPTGSLADHRLAIAPSDVHALAIAVLAELAPVPDDAARAAANRLGDRVAWARAVGRDLARHRGAGCGVVGERQPAAVHAIAHAIDAALGNLGRTVGLTESVLLPSDATLDDLAHGEVGAVVVIDTNPLYDRPELASVLAAAPIAVHATAYPDETSAACEWVLPLSHYLEQWGDGRALDGTVSFVQPLVAPIWGTRGPLELLGALAGDPSDARAHLLAHWRRDLRAARSDGFLTGTALPWRTPGLALDPSVFALAPRDPLELAIAPSLAMHDGRFAGNAWLQELPHPITKQCWGNAALMSPSTARALGVADGDLTSLGAPALIVPGHADDAITIERGYGRTTPAHPIADRVGTAPRNVAPARATGSRAIVRTQLELDDHGREIAIAADLATWRATGELQRRAPLPTLLPDWPQVGPQWAMTIDTSICTGCSSCVIACQAENNIPTVGAEGVDDGRIMHWLRIDRYGEVNQPMACQHCEHAPCEYVCPVEATTHSPDGLNEMTYQRCVGTRFCSNNCPYKVRRFNWFGYDRPATTRALQHNPDVTVRDRGVMEKCTYCVQRIRRAEIAARTAHVELDPSTVVSACAQACPTGAIRFGTVDDPARTSTRAYQVLHELGTRPRTTYLARIRDPDPEAP